MKDDDNEDNNFDSYFKILIALLYIQSKWEMLCHIVIHYESGDKWLRESPSNEH